MPIRLLPLALVLAVASPAFAGPDGARIYAERCAGCHGDAGAGDGPAAAALVPRPKSLRAGDLTAERIAAAVRKGRPGTMMMAFEGMLSDDEIDAVVRHVQGLAAPAR